MKDPVPPLVIAGGLPAVMPEVESLIFQLLGKRPKKRPNSAEDVVTLLEGLIPWNATHPGIPAMDASAATSARSPAAATVTCAVLSSTVPANAEATNAPAAPDSDGDDLEVEMDL
jgi:hypothetical protein